ncbi:S41 family peptidase [Chryseobacterium sp. KCF3-3]|uniref:S41 family peptidase n=1 Tax=Chryseobacterium sp. KCF3-3 TaxID=3231511 RepID=UPI0038B36D2E
MKNIFIVFFVIAFHATTYAQKDHYMYFMKTWNFIKYYHPDLADGRKDADSLFLETIGKVNANTSENTIITLLLKNLNHKFTGAPVIDTPKEVLSVNQDFRWYQNNKKISSENKILLNDIYNHRFVTETEKKDKTFDSKTNEFKKEENLPLAYRLLALAKLQGAIDYLYPHKYLMDKNAEVYFSDLVDQVIRCSSRKDFEVILTKVVSKMEDTHSFRFYDQLNFKNEIFHRFYFPPFDYMIVKDHLLVTEILLPEICSKANIHVGDQITEVNGKSVREIIKEKKELLSTSNPETFLYLISDFQKNLIWPDNLARKRLKIQSRDNKTHMADTEFVNFTNEGQRAIVSKYIQNKIRQKQQYTIDHQDIVYFKINDVFAFTNNISDDKLDEHMDSIFRDASSKKAIIFDMRGYPDWGGFVFHYVYKYFSPVENRFGKYYKPNPKNVGTYIPISYDGFGTYYPDIKNKTVHPYKGKVFMIVNPETLSMSEWNTMNLQNIFPNARTIGQRTAGADGDIRTITLPGGYNLEFTGNGIFYYDGSQTQKVGVKVNEFIEYSDDDIIQKRDLELERILKNL